MRVFSVVYNVVEKFLFDLVHQEVMNEILNKLTAKYLDDSNAADKVDAKLLSTKAFETPIAAFIKLRTGQAVAA